MNTSSGPRVRFAPSPTGFLHIGGARTALFNFLYARHHGGAFILRIEDTDLQRSTAEATEAILDSLTWLGLSWDEGPFFQSERTAIYKKRLDRMLAEGKAYRCRCSAEELEERRKAQREAGKPPRYDRRCRDNLNKEVDGPHVVRFLIPQGRTEVMDRIKGDVSFDNNELDDLVLARSDGTFTYNFVVVVDDVEMGITDVIRGDDHLNNTPKQILLYQAMGAPAPSFGHVPLILGSDRQRLSKRHGATSVQAYRDMGYLPHALVNFLARLGWSHKDQEIFSLDELIAKFDLDSVGSSAGVFNAEKLLWLNQHYIKTAELQTLLSEISRFLGVESAELAAFRDWERAIDLLRERSKTTKEMADLSRYFFLDEVEYDGKAAGKFLRPALRPAFQALEKAWSDLAEFDAQSLKPPFEALLSDFGLQMTDLAQPLRVALTGGTVSPGIYDVAALLGKDRAIKRIRRVIETFLAG